MLRIIIADDHDIVRKGIRQLLSEGFPGAYIEEVNDCPSLVQRVCSDRWDVVVSDLVMPGGGGLEALRVIRATAPRLPFLLLSINENEQYVQYAMKSGANGFLNKNRVPEELLKAIQTLLNGNDYLSPSNS